MSNAAKAEVKPLIHLAPSRMTQAEFSRVIYSVTCESGTTIDQLLESSYWAHVGAKFKPGDRIEVMPDDREFFAELLVMAAGRLYADMTLLRAVDLDKPKAVEGGIPYEVEHAGDHAKWRVRQGKLVLKEGFQSKAQAAKWAKNHANAIDR